MSNVQYIYCVCMAILYICTAQVHLAAFSLSRQPPVHPSTPMMYAPTPASTGAFRDHPYFRGEIDCIFAYVLYGDTQWISHVDCEFSLSVRSVDSLQSSVRTNVQYRHTNTVYVLYIRHAIQKDNDMSRVTLSALGSSLAIPTPDNNHRTAHRRGIA